MSQPAAISAENKASKPSQTSLEVVADWLIVLSKVYRYDPVPEELVIGFNVALGDLHNPEILFQAFKRVLQKSKFMPTPAEVIEAYNALLGLQPAKREPEKIAEEPMTPDELKAYNDKMNELRKKLALPPKSLEDEQALEARRQQLVFQGEKMQLKFPAEKP